MSTISASASAQPVNPAHNSILTIIKRHLLEIERHLREIERHLREIEPRMAALDRYRSQPSLTSTDRKASQRLLAKQRGRQQAFNRQQQAFDRQQQAIDDLVAAHPTEAWAKAYVSAVKTESTPEASQVD
jgi:hypothetical protein